MTYFVDTDFDGELTVWKGNGDYPLAVLRKCEIPHGHRDEFWSFIVGALDVRRYATLTLDSISVERQGMAEDILDLLNNQGESQ